MALTVGELTGIITLDASGVEDGIRAAERALSQASGRMGADAQRAGRQAGDDLGDGIRQGARQGLDGLDEEGRQAGRQLGNRVVTGADGELDDLTTVARRAGDDAGDALGDGLGDGGGAGADEAVGGMTEKLGKLKLAAAGIGAAAGALLMTAFNDAMEQGKITGRLNAQLGATGPEAQKYGHIAGRLYANAVTEDFQGAADVISTVMRAGIAPPDATEAQLESIATKVSDLSSTFELDLGQTANAVGQMIKNGLAKDGVEAVDVLTRGLQKMGPRADDIADTFNEYSTIFRSMGLSAQTATGLLSQGMKAGARDTDVVADAIKEFQIRATDGSTASAAGFEALGLSAKEMTAQIGKGGKGASDGLQLVLDKLRGMKDPVARNAAAVALFGTKAEDLGQALFSLDPSKAVTDLGKVGGAAERMGDSLRDNAGTKIEAFKRNLQQNLVEFLGGKVIPAFEGVRSYVSSKFSTMWDEAGANGTTGVDRVAAFAQALGGKLIDKLKELGPRAAEGLTQLGMTMAEWCMNNPDKLFKVALIANAIILGLVSLPLLVGAALIAAATAIMVSFGTRLVQGLGEWLGNLWTTFTTWISEKATSISMQLVQWGLAFAAWFGTLWSTYISGPVSRAWNNFIAGVKALPGRAVTALGVLGTYLSNVASTAWQRFKDGAKRKGDEFVSWVRGLPGQASRAMGSLGSLLYGKGQDIVRGIYRGVRSMGSWLGGQLKSFARSIIPGPIAKALGISSPSKVMAKTVGRWIPAGIVKGIESNSAGLDSTMANLVSTPTPSVAMAAGVSGAVAGASRGTAGSSSTSTTRVDLSGSPFGDFLVGQIRKAVGTRGGDVQLVLGK